MSDLKIIDGSFAHIEGSRIANPRINFLPGVKDDFSQQKVNVIRFECICIDGAFMYMEAARRANPNITFLPVLEHSINQQKANILHYVTNKISLEEFIKDLFENSCSVGKQFHVFCDQFEDPNFTFEENIEHKNLILQSFEMLIYPTGIATFQLNNKQTKEIKERFDTLAESCWWWNSLGENHKSFMLKRFV